MARGKRIEWKEEEQDRLFTAIKDIITKDVRTPLIKAANMAQLVLQEGRRRNINAISNLPAYLRNRLITNNLLDKNWDTQRKRGRVAPVADERDERIKQLEGDAVRLESERRALNTRVQQLENRPSAREEIEDFFAGILAKALQRSRAVPGGAPLADVAKMHAKHDPAPPVVESKPPVIVLVGMSRDEVIPLEHKFKGRAFLRFWNDAKLSVLAQQIGVAEFTLIRMEPPQPQAVLDAVAAVTSRSQRVMGGPHRMEEEIESYLERRKREKQAA